MEEEEERGMVIAERGIRKGKFKNEDRECRKREKKEKKENGGGMGIRNCSEEEIVERGKNKGKWKVKSENVGGEKGKEEDVE